MREVFVSYSSADQVAADRLVAALEKRGLHCWIASRDIAAGSNYQNEIPDAIGGCTVFLLLYSRQAAVNSQEIEKEMSIARRARKPFIPVRLDESQPERAFLFELATTQYIDIFPDFDDAVDKLSLQLGARVEKHSEVVHLARKFARRRAIRMWTFRAAMLATACVGSAVAWKAAEMVHAIRHPAAATEGADTAHGPSSAQPEAGPAAVPDLGGPVERARGFVSGYYAMAGAPAASWVHFLGKVLPDPITYYGRPIAKTTLLNLQRDYTARWPARSFQVREASMEVTCLRGMTSCQVTGIDDYTLRNDAQRVGVAGSDHFLLQLSDLAGPVTRVTSITATPIERHNLPPADAVAP